MLTPFVLLIALAAPPAAPASNEVRVGGSSSMLPVTRIMETGFRAQARSLHLRVLQATSTGRGFKQLCAGEVDVMAASRPILDAEGRACTSAGQTFVELPIAMDGVAVVAHRDATWLSSLTLAELRHLWSPAGKRHPTRWSQVRKGWPDLPVKLVAPGTGSGTRDFFAEALGLPGGARKLRAGLMEVDSGEAMVRAVAAEPGALGFLSTSYLGLHRDALRLVGVDDEDPRNGAGPIVASEDTVRSGAYRPFTRPVLLYVSARALEREGVASFVRFYVDNALRVTRKAGYVPLPPEAYRQALLRLGARRTGSLFAGRASPLSVEELLRRGAADVPAGR
ncbi:MAG TPA: substrate-binding domain-containing protein [Aggregicoccus sp.]|nr:substrate-binding domain-containing protein [Aggregicoccus sp.]